MFMPRGQGLVTDRREPRLLLLCNGRVRLVVDDVGVGDIGPGDLVERGPSQLLCRAGENRAVSRLHVFRIQFDRSQFTCDPKTGWLPTAGRTSRGHRFHCLHSESFQQTAACRALLADRIDAAD